METETSSRWLDFSSRRDQCFRNVSRESLETKTSTPRWDSSSSVLRQISSNGCRPLPPECHGLVDQISWLAYRQRLLKTDFSRQSVPIEKCAWKERIFVDISSCRDGDETCVIRDHSPDCITEQDWAIPSFRNRFHLTFFLQISGEGAASLQTQPFLSAICL